MKDTLTLSVKFKLAEWSRHKRSLVKLCEMYSACLKDGMTALIAQNEVNVTVGKSVTCKECVGSGYDVNNLECDKCQAKGVIEIKKPSGLTVSRRAMSAKCISNMKDSACQEVASTWKSYSALWDKQANRSFPTFKSEGLRFRLRERALKIDHETRTLKVRFAAGKNMEFGYLGSDKMYEVLENCSHGAFDVIKEKGEWFIRISCKVTPSKRKNAKHGPIITVHTGMNWCVCALAAYTNGSYRFLFVPYFPLWGAKQKHNNLRKSLQSKGKLSKLKCMGEKEYRIGNWYYHTVTKKLSQWIAEQRPRDVVLGEHVGIRSKAKKGKWKAQKKHNYWLSNYAFRSILEKLKYKLLMDGVEFSIVDTFKNSTTKTCSKCGSETLGLEKRKGRVCIDCGKSTHNEWNVLRNLLPESHRRLKRKKPEKHLEGRWIKLSIIESDLKRQLNGLCQRMHSIHRRERKTA